MTRKPGDWWTESVNDVTGGVPVWLTAWYEPPVWAGPVPRETPW